MLQVAVLLSSLILVSGLNSRENIDCYVTDNNPYLMFGTKTAYDLVYDRPRERTLHIEGCEPVQLWLLSRHGTRYPGRTTIRAMQELENVRTTIVQNHLERRNGRLCYGDLDHFKVWQLNASMSEAKHLTKQGRSEMYQLAHRFRNKFPSLFSQGYSQNMFVFRHTDTERTRQSAAAFAEGLFGSGNPVWLPPPFENDTVIKPYSNCTTWKRDVRNNTEYLREVELFRTGLEMSNLVHNVSQRLGFLYDLASDTILLMYDMCRYDKAWHLRERSTWCAAFTSEELHVLEYLEDLKTFYESGYGHEYNLRLGCTPIKDLIERFSQLENDNLEKGYQPTGVFYFTHSDMISMTLARLAIASRGMPMRHDNFFEQKKREWRASKLTPFTANLAAVFFKCKSGEYNRVMFFLNEKLVDYPGCEMGLCDWKVIRERFRDIPQSCTLDWCSSACAPQLSLLAILGSLVLRVFH